MNNPKGWMENKSTKKRGSSTPGNNRGKAAKIVVYCPDCPIPSMANPENSVRLAVSAKKRIATCPRGHVVHVGGDSIPQNVKTGFNQNADF